MTWTLQSGHIGPQGRCPYLHAVGGLPRRASNRRSALRQLGHRFNRATPIPRYGALSEIEQRRIATETGSRSRRSIGWRHSVIPVAHGHRPAARRRAPLTDGPLPPFGCSDCRRLLDEDPTHGVVRGGTERIRSRGVTCARGSEQPGRNATGQGVAQPGDRGRLLCAFVTATVQLWSSGRGFNGLDQRRPVREELRATVGMMNWCPCLWKT